MEVVLAVFAATTANLRYCSLETEPNQYFSRWTQADPEVFDQPKQVIKLCVTQ